MADVKKAVKAILERVNTAEKAVALKGKEREEYLKALDETFGSKDERAASMGLTKKVYHGTDAPEFEKFKPSEVGYYGRGVYVSDKPAVAEKYGKKTIPLRTSENLLDVRSYIDRLNIPKEILEKAKTIPDINNQRNQFIAREGGFAGLTAPYKSEHLITDSTKLRHEEAAFDPRFKDSDLIMAANKGKKSAVETGLNALSIPQKILMRKTAEAMGIDLGAETGEAGEDADKASEAIVEKAAQKLGIPEDSQLGALAKGAAKTALDIGYDPLSLVPVGKIAKITGKAKILPKILEKIGIGKKAAKKMPTMAEREAMVLTQKWGDVVAQERVAAAKEKRAAERWSKLSPEQQERIMKENFEQRQLQGLRDKLAAELRNKRTRVGRNVEAKPWSTSPEGIAHENAARQKINKRLEDEKQAQLSAAVERAKKDVQAMRSAPVDDDITQVIEDPLKKLVKKVAKP